MKVEPGDSQVSQELSWFFLPLGQPLGLPDGLNVRSAVPWENDETVRWVSICVRQLDVPGSSAAYPLYEVMDFADGMMRRGTSSPAPRDSESVRSLPCIPLTVAEVGVPKGQLSLSDSFDKAVDIVRQLQRAYGVLLQEPVQLLAKEHLPMAIPVIHGLGSEGRPPTFESMTPFLTSRAGARRSARAPDMSKELLDQLVQAFETIAPGLHPFSTYADLRNESWAQLRWEGNPLQAGITTGIAAEVFFDTLLLHLMWEERTDPADAAAVFEKQLKTRIVSEFHARLGGSWSANSKSPVGDFVRTTLSLRNRIAHAGYRPTASEVEHAQRIVIAVETHVRELLVRRIERWPATTCAWLGIRNLGRWGATEKQVGELKKRTEGFDGWGTFHRWRQQFVRERGGLPRPGDDPETLSLVWICPLKGPAFWVLWDRAARMAGKVDPPEALSAVAREIIEKTESELATVTRDEAIRVNVKMPKEALLSLAPFWVPDYQIVPDENLFLPEPD